MRQLPVFKQGRDLRLSLSESSSELNLKLSSEEQFSLKHVQEPDSLDSRYSLQGDDCGNGCMNLDSYFCTSEECDGELDSRSVFIPIGGSHNARKKYCVKTPPTRASETPVAVASKQLPVDSCGLESLDMSNSVVYEESSSSSSLVHQTVHHSSLPCIGDWVRLKAIGEGSSGRIYSCVSLTHKFDFAVKSILSDLVDDVGFCGLSDCIRNEIMNMSGLNHPHIIKCFGAEVSAHHLMIFMELCNRGTLSKYILGRKFLSELEASKICLQLLEAVNYLHSKRTRPLMHRDIKSSNILLADYDVCGGVYIKLCDFGSSTCKISDEAKSDRIRRISNCAIEIGGSEIISPLVSANTFELNKLLSSSVKGTCNWMAPEVLKGEPYSGMCDIWSIGCVVIEMLTGQIPWKSFENTLAGMYNIMTSTKTPLDFMKNKKELSNDCIDFLSKCLDRNADNRWTANKLLKHPWIKPKLDTIPGTPIGFTAPITPTDSPDRAII